MTYIVVDVDGDLHVRDTPPTIEAIRREVGEPGWDMVRLQVPGRGWVNDTGHEHLPRNPVGSVLLLVCGAPEHPYAGPVVVTGWDRHTEFQPLSPALLAALRSLHTDIRHALGGDGGEACTDCTPEWVAQVRRAAEWVTAAATPVMTQWPLSVTGYAQPASQRLKDVRPL